MKCFQCDFAAASAAHNPAPACSAEAGEAPEPEEPKAPTPPPPPGNPPAASRTAEQRVGFIEKCPKYDFSYRCP